MIAFLWDNLPAFCAGALFLGLVLVIAIVVRDRVRDRRANDLARARIARGNRRRQDGAS